jgi:hypothetical protein
MVRFHIIDRYAAWERPRIEAMEFYTDGRGYQAWRQHPWEPSGVEPVPADPEAAWKDFCLWCQGPPMNRTEPPLRRETYLRIFSEGKPYHGWEVRQAIEPENNGSQC